MSTEFKKDLKDFLWMTIYLVAGGYLGADSVKRVIAGKNWSAGLGFATFMVLVMYAAELKWRRDIEKAKLSASRSPPPARPEEPPPASGPTV